MNLQHPRSKDRSVVDYKNNQQTNCYITYITNMFEMISECHTKLTCSNLKVGER